MENKKNIRLIYIGKGAFLPNVPARDLTVDEVSKFGLEALLKSGLYQEPLPEQAKWTSLEEELEIAKRRNEQRPKKDKE